MRGEIVIGGQRFFRDYTCGVWRAECEWSNPEVNEYEAAMLNKIEQLQTAGDVLADTLSVQSEWTCCADGWFGPCGCPPDVVTRPTDDSVATVLAGWQEARCG